MARVVRPPMWPLPGRFAAVTIGETVFVKRGVQASNSLLAHELAHVFQWRRHGFSFPFKYLWAWARAGFSYWDNEFEVEARRNVKRLLPIARDVFDAA